MANTLNILLAGFGGQGILFAGKTIAYSGLLDGKEPRNAWRYMQLLRSIK